MKIYQEAVSSAVDVLSGVGVIPVLVLENVSDGMKMCSILHEKGLKAAEITFRTKAAREIISEASKAFPELFIGAGTILNERDLDAAFEAGASFAVAPGFNPVIVSKAVSSGYAFAPGVCTPSEVEQAHFLGCKFLKFFPAEAAGGLSMLKSIIAPYRHLNLRFMPTGGVTAANAADYLSIKEVAAVGGTWLGKSSDIEKGDWDTISKLVAEAVVLGKKS